MVEDPTGTWELARSFSWLSISALLLFLYAIYMDLVLLFLQLMSSQGGSGTTGAATAAPYAYAYYLLQSIFLFDPLGMVLLALAVASYGLLRGSLSARARGRRQASLILGSFVALLGSLFAITGYAEAFFGTDIYPPQATSAEKTFGPLGLVSFAIPFPVEAGMAIFLLGVCLVGAGVLLGPLGSSGTRLPALALIFGALLSFFPVLGFLLMFGGSRLLSRRLKVVRLEGQEALDPVRFLLYLLDLARRSIDQPALDASIWYWP
ncbi:MAG: hypothetical protein ACP5UI_02425 [Thermoprotei archaeon]|nr:hypothetical protein [TACK group archaeon]